MKFTYHTLIISIAVGLSYLWLKSPMFSPYALQLFAVTVLVYFGIKHIHKAKVWQLLPAHASVEMAVVTVAFLLLIGATGNLRSVLFFLSFVHLFVLAIKSDLVTAIVVTMEILLFHFSLTSNPTLGELSFLLSLPVVMLFFLFAKDQYYKTFLQQQNLQKQQQQLLAAQLTDRKLENFMTGFLGEKLEKLHRMSFFPRENQERMQAEMAEIAMITDELISQAKIKENQTQTEESTEDDATEITQVINASINLFEDSVDEATSTENPDVSNPEIDVQIAENQDSTAVTHEEETTSTST